MQGQRQEYRWQEQGSGAPVLLLHGLMGETDHWAATLRVLGSFCRGLALSVPILESDFSASAPGEMAIWVRRFLDREGIERTVVGGNSLGGHVALELALACPERVSGLILAGSSGLFERGFTRGVPHRPTTAWVREKMAEIFYDPRLATAEWVERVQHTVSQRQAALRLLHVARSAKRRNIEAYLPVVTAPTCLIWGEDDRITPPEVARKFRALMPRSELFFLPRCGHAPMLEQPAAFNAVLTGWLLTTGLVIERPPAQAGVAA